MKFAYNIYILLTVLILAGCRDDFDVPGGDSLEYGPQVDVMLSLNVDNFSVAGGTRAEEPSATPPDEATVEEKRIENIWVFQYDAVTGNELRPAQYFKIINENDLNDLVNGELKVQFTDHKKSIICVVANTSDESWGNGTNLKTYTGLKNAGLPNPEPIFYSDLIEQDLTKRKSLPMEGEKTAIIGETAKVEVDVIRMYAKLTISFGDLQLSGNDKIAPKSIEINNIPHYCRVEALAKDHNESSAYNYDVNLDWITRAFNTEEENAKDKEYIIYVPENIQGETENSDGKYKGDVAPKNALGIKLTMTNTYQVAEMGGAWFAEDVKYNIYPGGNNTNNFNVRRNNEYRLKTSIRSVDVHNPSSNCFVVVPGENLAFEPYYRTETGGVENPNLVPTADNPFPAPDDPLRIDNYLNPLVEDNRIERVEIIWQDKDVIGDNTNGNLVKYIPNEVEPYHSKIYVKTSGKEGNALIGAFNKKDQVIWSWHIWIAAHDPANVGKAVVYTTYDWDSSGIYGLGSGKNRVPGYAVMSCNLGALADVPTPALTEEEMTTAINNIPQGGDRDKKIAKTFGMLYQWGRKDPFPPMITRQQYDHDYDEFAAGVHYDNSNNKKTPKTGWGVNKLSSGSSYTTKSYSRFYSVLGNSNTVKGSDNKNSIKYSIANPCVFICGTNEINVGDRNNAGQSNQGAVDKWCQDINNYFNLGDWNAQSNAKLWGGLDPSTPGLKHFYYYIVEGSDGNRESNIFNNYGDQKSIFDPCPTGWRVPPGDLWLGFSKTGLNPKEGVDENKMIKDINYNFSKTGANGLMNAGGMYLYMTQSKWDQNGNIIANPGRDLFFPTQGSREGSGNSLRISYCGNYHSATTDYNNKVNILHIHNSPTAFKIFESFVSYTVKSMAAPIRCVRDTK